jgi:hypothetical protein
MQPAIAGKKRRTGLFFVACNLQFSVSFLRPRPDKYFVAAAKFQLFI